MKKPKVLLAGDSISFGYGPGVTEKLEGEFQVWNLPGNGGTSTNLLSHLDDWIVEPGFDVVHLNCGLHDIALDRETGCRRVPPGSYVENIHKIVKGIRDGTRSSLFWASTTPVIYWRHRREKPFDRREGDVIHYNRSASGVMKELDVAINDLHGVVEEAGRNRCLGKDGVHMTDFGNDLLSGAVADFIRRRGM